MRPDDFRPVFLAPALGDGGAIEVVTTRWWSRPPGRTDEQVRAFCARLAEAHGMALSAIDVAGPGGLSAALGRYRRLRVPSAAVRDLTREFAGAGAAQGATG